MRLPAIWLGKLLLVLLRAAGRGATSLPGKAALALYPKLLSKLGGKLDQCVVVTGTNGKTTTSSLLSGILATNHPIIHNREGANLPQGLTTAMLQQTSWFGRLRRKTALFEIDEATLPHVTRHLPVKVLVVTNVFRDQLDRYGELDTTVTKLQEGIAETDAVIVTNGDDPLARYIGVNSGRSVVYYGLSEQHAKAGEHGQMRDGAFCMQCGHELDYKSFFYGQLGIYTCPECGFLRTIPDYEGTIHGQRLVVSERGVSERAVLESASEPTVSEDMGPEPAVPESAVPEPTSEPTVSEDMRSDAESEYLLPTRGLYNVYNTLAAIAAARVSGVDTNGITKGLAAYRAPLGRMQGYQTDPPATLNLIKNPTGCDTVVQAVLAESGPKAVCIAINDLAADGKDVSWLWDADFERLAADESVEVCVTTGLRAEDMALRLKYAGYPPGKIRTMSDLDNGLQLIFEEAMALPGNPDVYILSTYTALYPTANWLEKKVTTDAKTTHYRTSVS